MTAPHRFAKRFRGAWARLVLAVGLVLSLLFFASVCLGESEASVQQLFAQGVGALKRGDHNTAIASFERLADLGVTTSNVAFDRGLAYLQRVRAKAMHPGDLGQAAAAFEEALRVDPSDEDARRALELVRAEVAKRTARRVGKAVVTHNEPLDRMVVRLLPEAVWAWGALVGSLVLAFGLSTRRSRSPAWQLAGVISTPIGAVLLVVFAPMAAQARYLRTHTYQGVIVVADASVLDEKGHPRPVDPIPEAAKVEVDQQKGGLLFVRYGERTGWVRQASVRKIMP